MAEHDTEFAIDGLESDDDRAAIEDELNAIEGVSGIEWVGTGDAVSVMYDYDILAAEEIKRAVREMGFDVEDEE